MRVIKMVNVELTRKNLLSLAYNLGAVEIKAGVPNVSKKRLWCVAYSLDVYGCNGRIYRDNQGNFFVAKNRDDACYFGN